MSRRLSIVDLTSGHAGSEDSSSTSFSPGPQRTRDSHLPRATPGPRGIKRRRQDDGFWSPGFPGIDGQADAPIESIDLTEPDNSLARALAKQREDAVKSQQPTVEKTRSILGSYNCPVCMDTPEDATSTTCGKLLFFPSRLKFLARHMAISNKTPLGHLFCHRCIVEYLNSSSQRIEAGKQARATCPICRKPITRSDKSGPKRSLIPLKLKLTTKKRSLVPPAEA